MFHMSVDNHYIVRVAIPVPLYRLFDYQPPAHESHHPIQLLKGTRVQVPFGRRDMIGFVMSVDQVIDLPSYPLKQIKAVLDEKPLLSIAVMQLLEWMSHYYCHPIGEVFSLAFPGILRRNQLIHYKTIRKAAESSVNQPQARIPVLSQAQQNAFEKIQSHFDHFFVFLLQGVTGSGKTEVYFQLIQKILSQNKQVLLLVPEISLTPQMINRLKKRFSQTKLAIFHSHLSDRQRLDNWELARMGQAQIVVGTRSAIFTPLFSPGMIILDEEHDRSFKQQQGGVHYHARDVAIMRAQFESIPIILGSATPSLESLENARQGRYQQLTLSDRINSVGLPSMHIMDVRSHTLISGLSKELLNIMRQHLTRKEQVLLFVNRRGFAPLYLCHDCGWVMMCMHCDSPLRFHQRPTRLRCHHCQYSIKASTTCPKCQQDQLFALGYGTQKIEKALNEYFADINTIRIDSDTTRGKDKLSHLLENIHPNEPAILIGTQILAKGHHFPNVTLSVIVDGDAGLFGSDFRSLEQAAQLIIQVAGRAGRADKVGQVMIQTHHPSHPLLNQLVTKGYDQFSQLALQERKAAGWPPFSYLALLRVDSRVKETAFEFLNQVKRQRCVMHPEVMVLGPITALLTKRAGYYRAQLLFQSNKRQFLHQVLKKLTHYLESEPKRAIRYSLEVDPLEIV